MTAITHSARKAAAQATATAGTACRVIGDEFDAQRVERGDELHQRVHVAADHAVTRFHALDGRQRESSGLSERALIDAEKRSGSFELASSDHGTTSEVMFHASV